MVARLERATSACDGESAGATFRPRALVRNKTVRGSGMRILYGVQGTGHGHLVRSAAMVAGLRRRGHEVHCLLTGRSSAAFADPEIRASHTLLEGFTGQAAGGRVRVLGTLSRLRVARFVRDVRSFDASGFDLVLTDYEPVSAWIARRCRRPSIGVGHLYAFHRRLRLPGRTGPARWALRLFAPLYTPVRTAVGLHWHRFGGANLPPTISPDIVAAAAAGPRPNRGGRFLVYLPAESERSIVDLLGRLPGQRFVAYRPVPGPVERGNVSIRPYDRKAFVNDLVDCAGVITNAGFSLASEALHLGRRLLVQPIRRHPEQFLNGRALTALGLGTVVERLTAEGIESWIDTPEPAPMNYPDVTRHLIDWIDGGAERPLGDLAADVWNEVSWRPA